MKKIDPRNQVISYEYDDLYRLTRVIKPDGSSERYQYDRIGNRTMLLDGNGNITRYFYNSQDALNRVIEAGGEETRYYYDLEGNLIRKEMANGLITKYSYNNLGQLIKEEKPGNKPVYLKYNEAGALEEKTNPLGIKEVYHYNKNNQIIVVDYYSPDSNGNYSEEADEKTSYTYDKIGNRILAEKRTGDTPISRIAQSYDSLNRIISENRSIEGSAYSTEYRYDRYGNLIGIKYPGSNDWLEYSYDKFNLLKGIENIGVDIASPEFSYHRNGSLESIIYPNGIETEYSLDNNSRIEEIKVDDKNTNRELLKLNYQYDGASNISRRNSNKYEYDHLNRLKRAEIEGNFFIERGSNYAYVKEDYLGDLGLNTNILETEEITLDYDSGSVGIDLGRVEENINRIELKTIGIAKHRLTDETIDIYLSDDNIEYHLLERDQWEYSRDPLGNITIQLNDISTRYLKVHSKFTDRNPDFEIVNIGEFKNILKELIRVYQRNENAVINYEYDEVGNRTRKILNSGSNRLMTDGSYGYLYDEAGNLIEKGNRYNIEGDSVIFTETEGSGVEYWEYEYNLQNRLSRVRKNGELIAEFVYDADGMRVKAEEKEAESSTLRTTYYVYSYSGSVLMEESTNSNSDDSSETKYTSYIYSFAKTFAKVDGILDPVHITAEKIAYFHHDNLGSTRLMTDGAGNVVMEQDYMPFGEDLPVVGQTEVLDEEAGGYKYTGQKEVVSIGLYYYGARYYDPSIGRFITEDSWPGEMVNPQSQNLYVYVMNNPLKYIDPTGHNATENNENYDKTMMDFRKYFSSFISFWDVIKNANVLSEQLQNNLDIESILPKFELKDALISIEHTHYWPSKTALFGGQKVENVTKMTMKINPDAGWSISSDGSSITYQNAGMEMSINNKGELVIDNGRTIIEIKEGDFHMDNYTHWVIEGGSNNYFNVKTSSKPLIFSSEWLPFKDVAGGYIPLVEYSVEVSDKPGQINIKNITTISIREEFRDFGYAAIGAFIGYEVFGPAWEYRRPAFGY